MPNKQISRDLDENPDTDKPWWETWKLFPVDSKPDLPPYGSKVSEDGKPVTRAELETQRKELLKLRDYDVQAFDKRLRALEAPGERGVRAYPSEGTLEDRIQWHRDKVAKDAERRNQL